MAISLKEILKAVSTTFAATKSFQSLPQPLEESIQALLYEADNIDESASQRVQEELLNTFNKHVTGDEGKTTAFLQLLQLFRPYLIGEDQKLHWYKAVIHPILDNVGRLRVDIDRACSFMLAVLDYDADDENAVARAKESQHFTKILLDGYLARTGHFLDEEAEYSLENEHIASQFEQILVDFGKKKPKELMLAVDQLIVSKIHRVQALSLLTTLVCDQPPRLHQVSQTPLIEHLLQCLMIDTSALVVQLALTALVMFLPHIPTAVRKHLPRLFLIYSRLLCWDQIRNGSKEEGPEAVVSDSESEEEADDAWQKLSSAIDGEEPIPLDMIHYFTFLYGLYPLNFTSFIRKPRRYLKDIKFPRAEQLDLDQDVIRTRTEPFRQKHLMHSNFYLSTAEEELEEDRFLSSDASDIVAECIGLVNNVGIGAAGPTGGPTLPHQSAAEMDIKDIPADSLLAGDDDASTVAESTVSTTDSLHLLASRKSVTSPSGQSDFANPKTARSVSALSRGHSRSATPSHRSIASLSEPHMDRSILQGDALLKVSEKSTLQRQVLILRNDLNYERYLKQQHLAHIGQLQRRHVADATLSANVENLMALNKSLRSKLAKANDSYAALKKETATGRAQSKEWELKLSSQVRTMREGEKVSTRAREELQLEVKRLQSDNDALRKLVVESESRELLSRQKLATMNFELERVKETQKHVVELESQVKEQQTKAWSHEQAAKKHENARLDLESLKMQMMSQVAETDKMRKAYEKRIRTLEERTSNGSTSLDHDAEVIERVRRANGTVNELYSKLQEKHATLQRRLRELEHRHYLLQQETGNSFPGTGQPVNSAQVVFSSDDSDEHSSTELAQAISTGGQPITPSRPGRSASEEPVGASSAPAQHAFSLMSGLQHTPGNTNDSDGANEGAGDSASGRAGPFYQHRKSAFRADSLEGSQAKPSSKNGKSGNKSSGPRGVLGLVGSSPGASKDGEKKKKKGSSKTGAMRGIRGLM